MSETIVDVSIENAQQYVIDESFNRPVVVDFWADWCQPCKTLMPILEKIAKEYEGAFLLAKVNADDQQMLAGQFGVRSLPTVMVIQDGQPVDGFAGAQPEAQVREMLEKYLPKPWDNMLSQAQALAAEEKYAEALPILKSAYEASSMQADIAFAYSAVLIHLKRIAEVKEVVGKVKLADQNQEYEKLLAQIELAENAKRAPELEALERAHKDNPDDKDVCYELAVQYGQNDFHREALEQLLNLLKSDINFRDGEAKKLYIDILKVLGGADPIAADYQRKLYTMLY